MGGGCDTVDMPALRSRRVDIALIVDDTRAPGLESEKDSTMLTNSRHSDDRRHAMHLIDSAAK